MSKKFLALVLAATMVFGSTITAFATDGDSTTPKTGGGTTLADDSTAVEGDGTEEGLVDTRKYRVTLPVIPETSLDYAIDPQGLIKKTNAAAYGGITVGDGNLFFVNHETLDATTEGKKTGLSGETDEFSLVNKSTFPIKVTVTTKVTAGSGSGDNLVAGIASAKVPTGTDVAIIYSDNATKKGDDTVLLSATESKPEAVLGDASAAYKYSYADGAYSYAIDSAGTYEFATLKFKFTGAVTVDDTKTGSTLANWTIKTAATSSSDEVRYDAIVAPTISVKYKLDEYTTKSGEAGYKIDVAGPAASESGSGSGSGSTTTSYALTAQSNGNLTYQFASGSYPTGSLTAITINGTGRQGQITSNNITYNATNGFFKITAAAVTTCEITQGNTTAVATIGGTQYTFTY